LHHHATLWWAIAYRYLTSLN